MTVHWAVDECAASTLPLKRATAHAQNAFHSPVDKDGCARIQKANVIHSIFSLMRHNGCSRSPGLQRELSTFEEKYGAHAQPKRDGRQGVRAESATSANLTSQQTVALVHYLCDVAGKT